MFLGRGKETRKLIASLSLSRNVILSGKYGMGRTSLVRNAAQMMNRKWQFIFVDFTETPDRICRRIENRMNKGTVYKTKDVPSHYKSRRRRLAVTSSKGSHQYVLVLDNIAKLTAQKLNLIRYWIAESSFRFVAITESFLSDDELLALRLVLLPVDVVKLNRLQLKESMDLIRSRSKGRNPPLTEAEVKALASAVRGYPLGIVEMTPVPCIACPSRCFSPLSNSTLEKRRSDE